MPYFQPIILGINDKKKEIAHLDDSIIKRGNNNYFTLEKEML